MACVEAYFEVAQFALKKLRPKELVLQQVGPFNLKSPFDVLMLHIHLF